MEAASGEPTINTATDKYTQEDTQHHTQGQEEVVQIQEAAEHHHHVEEEQVHHHQGEEDIVHPVHHQDEMLAEHHQQQIGTDQQQVQHEHDLLTGEKRSREDYLDADLLAQQQQFEELKKAKLDEEASLHGVMPEPALGLPYFTTTGNIKSPLFEGVPSLTPEWLLKKVWLKVNGDLDANVLASMISKDMGPKLRLEIRSFLEKHGEVQNGCRINLKGTIMQAIEIMVAHQQDKPMLVILRDPKIKPRKEGKLEKNFAVSLTPYGQLVCVNELQLKKRDASNPLRTSSGSKGLPPLGSLSSSDNLTALTTTTQTVTIPDTSSSTLPLPLPPPAAVVATSAAQQLAEHAAKWAQQHLVPVPTTTTAAEREQGMIMMLKTELERREQLNHEYRNIILALKPDYPLPPNPEGMEQLEQQQQQHHLHHHQHAHPHVVVDQQQQQQQQQAQPQQQQQQQQHIPQSLAETHHDMLLSALQQQARYMPHQ